MVKKSADGFRGPGGGGIETRQAQSNQKAAQHDLHIVPMLFPGTGDQHVRRKLSSTVKLLFYALVSREEAVLDVPV